MNEPAQAPPDTRWFVMTGGVSADELMERAGQHGTPGHAVVDKSPHPTGCYGAVEINHQPERSR